MIQCLAAFPTVIVYNYTNKFVERSAQTLRRCASMSDEMPLNVSVSSLMVLLSRSTSTTTAAPVHRICHLDAHTAR